MPEQEDLSETLRKLPYPIVALGIALLVTGGGYFFVSLAKFMYEFPQKLDIPWIFVFLVVFLVLLARNRIKMMRADEKPVLK